LSRSIQNIVATADTVGGVWTYALDLAAAMSRRGVRTTLAVHGPAPSDAQRRQAAETGGLQLVELSLPLDWTAQTPDEILSAAGVLRDLAVQSGADLLHLNSPIFAAARYPLPVVGVIHSSVATWWSAVRTTPMPEDFVWRTQMLGAGLVACDALIAPTAAFADAVSRTHDVGLPFVVHNGRSRAVVVGSRERQRMVVTSGRLWDPGKNAELLDEVAGLIDAPLVAVGPLEGPNGEKVILRHTEAAGLRPSDALQAILARAPIFASAALYEPFGLGVLEAAIAGCALVLSDIPTFREIWHGAATFLAPHDRKGFANVIQHLLDHPAKAARLGAEAQSRAAALTVDPMVEGTFHVYAAAACRHRRRLVTEAAA
jgi:glycogen(starch) synthase